SPTGREPRYPDSPDFRTTTPKHQRVSTAATRDPQWTLRCTHRSAAAAGGVTVVAADRIDRVARDVLAHRWVARQCGEEVVEAVEAPEALTAHHHVRDAEDVVVPRGEHAAD